MRSNPSFFPRNARAGSINKAPPIDWGSANWGGGGNPAGHTWRERKRFEQSTFEIGEESSRT